jgi:hypothetical protein
MRRFFWSSQTTQRQLIGGWRWRVKRRSMLSRAVRRRRSNCGRGKQNGWWPLVVTSGCRDKGASPCGAVIGAERLFAR